MDQGKLHPSKAQGRDCRRLIVVNQYTFADNQTNKAHGLVTNTSGDVTLGAWWVGNQRDTGYGGPVSGLSAN